MIDRDVESEHTSGSEGMASEIKRADKRECTDWGVNYFDVKYQPDSAGEDVTILSAES